MNKRPTPDELKAALQYDVETGNLFWRHRADRSVQWNGRYAGKEALGSVNAQGYKAGRLNDFTCTAHRVIIALVTGEWPQDHVDHINGDRCDNRWLNLRQATQAENNRNSKKIAGRSSRYRGVSWAKRRGRWEANIQTGSAKKHIGYFDNEEAAARAYDAAAIRLHGEFARLNFPALAAFRGDAMTAARDDLAARVADLRKPWTIAENMQPLLIQAADALESARAENARLRAMLTPPDDLRTYTVDYLVYNEDHGLPGDMPMVPADVVNRLRANAQAAAAQIVRSVWGRCEALEDEAADKLANPEKLTDHEKGFWRGQKTVAKSIRRSTEMPNRAEGEKA